ncbi:hypothetical protein A605_13165 [Corynebacterium halotolerans YIM 70093 = DSM 44683]|uniref:Peptidoglycan recognition protein family domain-containing protein n=1 Tax=Corynebacterium halotolerans YIM 70093 = DSM 44683 TaxID=1121362 RepID=M1N129_9CORY|nr:hypothetical protein A605_13165 [Corynebacterium halotolerans YIM 70093 = DSM 44683]
MILSTALVVAAAFGGNRILNTQGAGSGPVEASEATVSLASGENVVVDDAAISAQSGEGGERTVKEFTRDEQFSMFALTWYGHQDIAAFVRAENADGTWGPWYAADPLAETGPDGKTGTDLIYLEPTNKVQVSLTGVDLFSDETAPDVQLEEQPVKQAPAEQAPAPAEAAPTEQAPVEAPVEQAPAQEAPAQEAPAQAPEAGTAPEEAPAPSNGTAPLPSNYGAIRPVADVIDASEIEAVFIDGNAADGGIALASESTTYGMPDVVTRAGWGANESLRCDSPTIDNQVSAVTIHHTAGSNNYSQVEAASVVRGIYRYHASTLGWCDVGYNALVDKYGTIYEGRAGGLDKAVQGAHVGGFNQNTWGVSMIGNYDITQPSPEMIRSVGELAGWKAAISGFHPKGTDQHYAEFSFGGSKYAAGGGGTFPNINAHRDFHYNTCPGQYGYAQMDNIRDIAADKYQEIESGTGGSSPSSSAPDGSTTQSSTSSASPEPTDTGTNEPAPEPGPAPGTPTALLSSIVNGDESVLTTLVGSLAALAITAALSDGELTGGSSQVGDVELIEGLTISDLTPIISTVISLSGDSEIEQAWNRINASAGPVLGSPRGGIATTGYLGGDAPVDYALFDRGIILDSEETGTNALWGAIADAWAGQGFDLGPLGLPLNEEYAAGDLVRVDFQGGYVTYDPATNQVDIQLN